MEAGYPRNEAYVRHVAVTMGKRNAPDERLLAAAITLPFPVSPSQ